MHTLELPALRDILAGSVGVFNAYNLCHIRTINWDEIITGKFVKLIRYIEHNLQINFSMKVPRRNSNTPITLRHPNVNVHVVIRHVRLVVGVKVNTIAKNSVKLIVLPNVLKVS